jgi:hypothetical protein
VKLPIWLYDTASVAVAVTLLLAGASKLFRPAPLAEGLGKVFRWAASRRALVIRLVRGVAAAEVTAALLVPVAWLNPVGLVLAGVLGLAIAGFAVSAIVLGRTVACGCFGETGGRPLGPGNVAAGIALCAGSFLAFLGASTGTGKNVLLPAVCAVALAWVLFKHRARLAGPFARHFRSFSRLAEGTETSG